MMTPRVIGRKAPGPQSEPDAMPSGHLVDRGAVEATRLADPGIVRTPELDSNRAVGAAVLDRRGRIRVSRLKRQSTIYQAILHDGRSIGREDGGTGRY
jgi:hypothetical protein